MTQESGLSRAVAIYKDRALRTAELKAEGKKVIGYICAYPVLEILTALKIVPFRIFGDINEP
ncbi:MAG: hypothetical protein V3T68_02775, partial [Dehalococcoidales bacterium]